MAKSEEALANFNSNHNCAQSIFAAYCDEYEIDKTLALRLASAFGGGMGRAARVCGAVSGAIMVIGLQYGTDDPDDEIGKERTYVFAREFVDLFEKANGSLDCRDLLGYDIGTEEGLAYVKENGLSETICAKLLQNATDILDELL